MGATLPTRRGFSLRDRLLLFTFAIVVGLLALTLGIIDAYVRRQVRHQLADELITTEAVFASFMDQRARWLRAMSLVVAEAPRFSAAIDLPDADPASHARTVLPQAKRFQNILGSDLFVVTDAVGRALAQLEIERPGEVTARHRAEAEDHELWTAAGGLFRVVTRPVAAGSTVLGEVSVGVSYGADTEAPDGDDLAAWVSSDAFVRRLEEAAGQSLSGVVWELQQAFGADLVAVRDAAGQLLELVVCEASSGQDLSSWPSVAAALDGRESRGLRVADRRMFHAVGVPVWSPDGLIGTLTTGFEIDDALAADLQATTHSDVSFFDDRVRLLATSWDDGPRALLETAFRRRDAGATAFELDVGGQRYLARAGRFGQFSADGVAAPAAPGTYLIQRSLDEAFAFLYVLERVLLGVGAAVLALAAALSFVGARRITRPVRALVEGTRRLAAGELGHRITERSRSELGELAQSFNDMAGSLSQSREALEESERAYRDLFDNAQDLVLTTDLERRITTVNQAGLQYLGYAHEELRGRSFFDLVDAADRERIAALEASLEPGTPRAPFEAALRRADGQQATFEVVSRWVTEGGEPVGIHAIGRDITQRRERERATIRFREQLAEAEKLRALGEMAAGVAHNFNNLLTVVVGNAELISLQDDIPEPIRQDTERILESARRCSAIVRRIQTFGRPIDMADTDLIDLAQVVRDTVDITRPKWKTEPELAGRSVDVDLDLAPVPPILSQGSAWEEIISNLIFNAVDAMPEGGSITVSTRTEDSDAVIAVRDTGTGMDEETQRRIFEPFFSTKDESAGTGLGLSTVWGLVQTLGGEISVDSQLAVGTTFTIRMPSATPTRDADEPERGDTAPATQSLRVLLVDDEPRVLELLPPILSAHQVETAAGGGAGLERVRTETYDVVFSDWVMADASGLEIAAAVKERHPDTVMVLMTGWQLDRTPAQGHEVIDLRLAKPFEREDVERVMGEALQLWQTRRAGAAS